MKYFKYIILGLLGFTLFSTSSCSDSYLDTAPSQSVSAGTISNTVDGLYLALNGIHRKMVSQDLGIQSIGGEPGFMFSREAHAI